MAWLISFSLLLCINIATSKLHFGMVSVRSTQESWRKTYCVVYDPGWFEPTLSNAVVTYDHISTINEDCYPTPTLNNSVLLVEMDKCSVYNKAMVATMNGAKLMIVFTQQHSLPKYLTGGTEHITIPVIFTNSNFKDELIQQDGTYSNLILSLSTTIGTKFNCYEIILFLIAIVTVILGAVYGTKPFEFLRHGLLQNKDEEQQEVFGVMTSGSFSIPKMLKVTAFVAIVSLVLLLMCLFYYPLVYIVIPVFVFGCCVSMYEFLSPIVALLPFLNCRLNRTDITRYHPDLKFFLTVIFSVAMVTWWVLERNESYIWILHNILGAVFIVYVIKHVIEIDTWMVVLLLILMLCYDVFFVFITPLFSKGTNVMLAATGASAYETSAVITGEKVLNSHNERIPTMFSVPKLYFSELEEVCIKHITSPPCTYLGYGDVTLPGIFISHCLKYDLKKHFVRGLKLYFILSLLGYIVGLLLSFIVLSITAVAQPALLYIVPSVLAPVLLTAGFNKEMRTFLSMKNSHNPNTLDLVFLIAEKEKQDSDSQEIDSRVSSPILKLYGESLP